MSASTGESPVGGNKATAKGISGWTAFDLEQRRKQQGPESGNDSESYPSLSSQNIPPRSSFNKNASLIEKPFSSVVVASMNFPSLTDIKNENSQRIVPASSSCLGTVRHSETADTIKAHQKLKYLHPWADKSLIQDVLAGVDNNFHEALSLLEAMLICENEDDKNNQKSEPNWNDFVSFDIRGTSLGEKEDMSCTSARDPVNDSYKQSNVEAFSIELLDAAKSLPIESEPKWEENDVYLTYRKDAIRMIRSASRCSRASNDAYIRGDHKAAHHLSLKAQQERIAAEKLNAKAAKEILNLRNSQNDLWTLDLHGLHAAEAVDALRDRLKNVESLMSPNCLATNKGVQKDSGMLLTASAQSTNQFEMEKYWRQPRTTRQRTALLQVITGKGNHSRGAAALPSAIKNFLTENGYHFDETRPGVIMIRPKFRNQ